MKYDFLARSILTGELGSLKLFSPTTGTAYTSCFTEKYISYCRSSIAVGQDRFHCSEIQSERQPSSLFFASHTTKVMWNCTLLKYSTLNEKLKWELHNCSLCISVCMWVGLSMWCYFLAPTGKKMWLKVKFSSRHYASILSQQKTLSHGWLKKYSISWPKKLAESTFPQITRKVGNK